MNSSTRRHGDNNSSSSSQPLGEEGDENEAASPRVRLTEARLLDGRLQQSSSISSINSISIGINCSGGTATPGEAPSSSSTSQHRTADASGSGSNDSIATEAADEREEEYGCLIVNDAFDMLIRKNDESNDDTIRDMSSAITDLQKWRELRNRELALELDGMKYHDDIDDKVTVGGGGGGNYPETNEEEEDNSDDGMRNNNTNITRGADAMDGQKDGAEYRHADDRTIDSLSDLLRSPRLTSGVEGKEEADVRDHLDRQTQRIEFSRIEQETRGHMSSEMELKLQQELLDMESAEAEMGALNYQLRGFESELDGFLERNK